MYIVSIHMKCEESQEGEAGKTSTFRREVTEFLLRASECKLKLNITTRSIRKQSTQQNLREESQRDAVLPKLRGHCRLQGNAKREREMQRA